MNSKVYSNIKQGDDRIKTFVALLLAEYELDNVNKTSILSTDKKLNFFLNF